MKRKLLALSLVLGPLLCAEVAETSGRDLIIKVVPVHGDAGLLAHLAGGPRASAQGSDQLKAVVIKGTPADVAVVERSIHELDAASPAVSGGKNIELVVYVIGGSMEPLPGATETSGDALAPVVKQLRTVFPYKNYQTLGTMLLRSSQGSKTISTGIIKSLQKTGNEGEVLSPSTYQLKFDSARATADSVPVIHLDKFEFESRIPVVASVMKSKDGSTASSQFQSVPIGTQTDVDLREGQKVVVANSNIGNTNVSLFLVLAAHLVP